MKCDDAENEDAAKAGHRYFGPPGGYKVELRDGVTVRLRFSSVDGVLRTEYRISSRWKLPSPIQKLLQVVERVFKYLEEKQHHVIPFAEAAREHLLGCQLEQSLLGDDCNKAGDTIGEAQHGQAAGQIGIYSALLAVLQWGATPADAAPADINIEEKDVELAEIVIRVSLLLKRELRGDHNGQTAPSRQPADIYAAPAHRALTMDVSRGNFATVYNTQDDGLTQVARQDVMAQEAAASEVSGAATPLGGEEEGQERETKQPPETEHKMKRLLISCFYQISSPRSSSLQSATGQVGYSCLRPLAEVS